MKKTVDKETGWIIVEDYDEDDDDVDCCAACGNEAYPKCMDSCPLFND